MAPCKFIDLDEESEAIISTCEQSPGLNKEYGDQKGRLNPDAIKVMLKEYETLRQESLDSIGHRNTILTFGSAAIGAIFAGSIVAYSDDPDSFMPKLALIVVIPFICCFVVLMWLGEYERMQRAGRFLVGIERRINRECSKELLTWETRLREDRTHMRYPYISTVALLIGISFILFSFGAVTLDLQLTLMCSLIIVGILVHLGLYLFVTSHVSRLRL